MRLVLDQGAEVSAWVAGQIPHMFGDGFGPAAVAIGVVDRNGQGVGGVVFTDYLPKVGNIQLSFAATRANWLTKRLITAILRYPFRQLGVQRLTAVVPPSATNATQFLTRMGWKREGVIRLGYGNEDAVIWGLLASEWKWSRFNLDRAVSRGQVDPTGPDAARPKRRRRRSKRREHRLGDSAAAPQPGRVH